MRGLSLDFTEPVAIEQPAAETSVGQDERSRVKEDGTLVIDILVRQPCGAGEGAEIVVCAPDPAEHRLDTPPPPDSGPGFRPEIQLAPNVTTAARAETDAETGANRLMIDLRIAF